MTGTNTWMFTFEDEEEAYVNTLDAITMLRKTTGNFSVTTRQGEDGTDVGYLRKVINTLNIKPGMTEFYIKSKCMGCIDANLYKDKVKLSPDLGTMTDVFVDGKYGVVIVKENITNLFGLAGSYLMNNLAKNYIEKDTKKDIKKKTKKSVKKSMTIDGSTTFELWNPSTPSDKEKFDSEILEILEYFKTHQINYVIYAKSKTNIAPHNRKLVESLGLQPGYVLTTIFENNQMMSFTRTKENHDSEILVKYGDRLMNEVIIDMSSSTITIIEKFDDPFVLAKLINLKTGAY